MEDERRHRHGVRPRELEVLERELARPRGGRGCSRRFVGAEECRVVEEPFGGHDSVCSRALEVALDVAECFGVAVRNDGEVRPERELHRTDLFEHRRALTAHAPPRRAVVPHPVPGVDSDECRPRVAQLLAEPHRLHLRVAEPNLARHRERHIGVVRHRANHRQHQITVFFSKQEGSKMAAVCDALRTPEIDVDAVNSRLFCQACSCDQRRWIVRSKMGKNWMILLSELQLLLSVARIRHKLRRVHHRRVRELAAVSSDEHPERQFGASHHWRRDVLVRLRDSRGRRCGDQLLRRRD
mmetsp:Transcript_8079/g.26857  ORF Transcript_8079/g.26857 Transcript_8079/m.26857 type:complete len:297 (+) Transcript_8079:1390-2280(+)